MSNQQVRNKKINRRKFVNYTGTLMALGMVGLTSNSKYFENNRKHFSKIRIKNVDSNFEREPLTPYHFKGSFVTELWQTIARLFLNLASGSFAPLTSGQAHPSASLVCELRSVFWGEVKDCIPSPMQLWFHRTEKLWDKISTWQG